MIIQGQVTQVLPPHYTDDFGNLHQWVTVQTDNGPIVGVKASKKELSPNFVNQQVGWDMVNMKDGQGQLYNKFKRPPQQNLQAQTQQVQTAINQGTQAYQQPAQKPNVPQKDERAEGMVRHGVVCAYIGAGVDPDIQTVKYWTEFIMTGQAPPPPDQTEGQWEH